MYHQDEMLIRQYTGNSSFHSFDLGQRSLQLFKSSVSFKKFIGYDFLAVFFGIYWYQDVQIDNASIYVLLIYICCYSLIVSDNYKMILPDSVLLALLCVGLVMSASGLTYDVLTTISNSICVFYSLYIFIVLYELLRKREVMGRGDIKLISICFLFIPITFLSSFVVVASIFFLATTGIKRFFETNNIEENPFGPSICISFLLHYELGNVVSILFVRWS
ncbi:hypothetical protein BM526_19845 (plasmid) [Alteromonas mediterranea]|nr:hypothetical protein BM526_19845 [Alteromonas mediterranea]